MMANKKEFFTGLAMMAAFVVVLVIIFSPLFKGHNGLEYLDSLYNSISKGSAYYIPAVKEEIAPFEGKAVKVTLHMADPEQAKQTAMLFEAGGASVTVNGRDLKISGDLGQVLENCLVDADHMYFNRGEKVSDKYGYDARRVLFDWWNACKGMDKSFSRQKEFKAAKIVSLVAQKAVETAYNYYGIAPQKITDRMGVVIFSLVFYVVYTLWYGFAIMFMFEGWGLRLEH
ncbi:MAG: hypothetical protein U5R49_14215 [Deltaproteobacteria bacterium]|nr:hypothetical protein [Deltaproteobacteria bacterium]